MYVILFCDSSPRSGCGLWDLPSLWPTGLHYTWDHSHRGQQPNWVHHWSSHGALFSLLYRCCQGTVTVHHHYHSMIYDVKTFMVGLQNQRSLDGLNFVTSHANCMYIHVCSTLYRLCSMFCWLQKSTKPCILIYMYFIQEFNVEEVSMCM